MTQFADLIATDLLPYIVIDTLFVAVTLGVYGSILEKHMIETALIDVIISASMYGVFIGLLILFLSNKKK